MKNEKGQKTLETLRLLRILFVCAAMVFASAATGLGKDETPSNGQDSAPNSVEAQIKKQNEEIKKLTEDLRKLREDAEVRGQLEVKPEEKKASEESLLDAVGRQYTLLSPGLIGLEYQFSYSYYSSDALSYIKEENRTKIEHDSNHNILQTLTCEYPVLANLTASLSVPFATKFDRSGQEESMEKSDFGDISTGFQFQPFSSAGGKAAVIFFGNASFPTGKSPYETVRGEELSTGDGVYSFTGGFTTSRSAGSVMLFGGLFYTHALPEDDLEQKHGKNSAGEDIILKEVKPGDRIGGQCGVSWSMSYDISMNLSYQYAYGLESEYTWSDQSTVSTQSTSSSVIGFGIGWRIKPETSINMKVSAGLTTEDPDFMVSMRLPFQFSL